MFFFQSTCEKRLPEVPESNPGETNPRVLEALANLPTATEKTTVYDGINEADVVTDLLISCEGGKHWDSGSLNPEIRSSSNWGGGLSSLTVHVLCLSLT